MSNFSQDLRHTLRRLRQAPGFALVCVLTLALGIGANTAIFTLIHAVMLKSLPVAKPGELYRLGSTDNCCVIGGLQDNWAIYSYSLYQQFRDHTPEFSELAAFQAGITELSVRRSGSNAAAQPCVGEFVSGNYFSMFGVGAFAGRVITPADDKPGAPPMAVMSYRAWQQHFGQDPSVVGATFNINQMPYTVAGVAPPGFFGDTLRPDPADFWLPIGTEPALDQQNSILNRPTMHWLYAIGRVRPGVRPETVQSKATVELQQWLNAQPDLTVDDRSKIRKQRVGIIAAGGGVTSMQNATESGLRLLMIVAGLVLLMACANIANLLLARAAANRSDIAIRVALGAPRHRLLRQMVSESVLLALVGGALGLLVAWAGTRVIVAVAFRGAHYVPISTTPELPVLAFAFLLSLVTGVVFGVAPAWIASHADPAEALRGAGRSTRDRAGLARRSLVVLQVALSSILLIGAGLLTVTLRNLEDQKFGFEPQGRMVVRINPALAGYKPEKLYALYQQFEQRLPRIPGVISASYSLYSPMRGDNWSFNVSFEGRPSNQHDGASFNRVSPHYFETLGTRVLRGRAITEQDTPNSRQVVVINEAFARKYFPKENPIGRRFGLGDAKHAADWEIVGVVEDTKYQDARLPAYATFFMPFLQISHDPAQSFMIGSHYAGDIELRVAGKPENFEGEVRRTLASIDPNLTVLDVLSMNEQLTRNFNQERLIARLTELFGSLALILACVGLYGVTAYSVARRTSEIGIRVALGADRMHVLRLVLRSVIIQLGVGLAIGIPLAIAGGRFAASLLYGIRSYDPRTLVLAVVVLGMCALVAGSIPARRAASIDPVQALRTE